MMKYTTRSMLVIGAVAVMQGESVTQTDALQIRRKWKMEAQADEESGAPASSDQNAPLNYTPPQPIRTATAKLLLAPERDLHQKRARDEAVGGESAITGSDAYNNDAGLVARRKVLRVRRGGVRDPEGRLRLRLGEEQIGNLADDLELTQHNAGAGSSGSSGDEVALASDSAVIEEGELSDDEDSEIVAASANRAITG